MTYSPRYKPDVGGFAFSEANVNEATAIIAKYPPGRQASAVMPLLDLAQRQNEGWLSQPAIEYVAQVLDMPPIRVQEVASFYTMYNLEPIGRHHVQVCTSLSCSLRGSAKIVDTCKKVLGIGFGETTEDGAFTMSEVECLCACVNAPVVQIDDDFYEDLTPETAEKVLSALAKGETPKTGPQIGRHSSEPIGGLTTLKDVPDAGAMGAEATATETPKGGNDQQRKGP